MITAAMSGKIDPKKIKAVGHVEELLPTRPLSELILKCKYTVTEI